tara:strand:+ start:387 stop:572 length:186 start_codon:yes stop_codon:yes gene_type:complete
MKCENWSCWKDCIELALKVIFVGVFTWGVMSAVCCMSSCGSKDSCCKTTAVEAGKPCSSGK